MRSLKSPCRTSYWSSVDYSSKLLTFCKKKRVLCTRFSASVALPMALYKYVYDYDYDYDRQTDRQTDRQHHRVKAPHIRAEA